MDSHTRTTSPAAPESVKLATMLHNAIIDKAERSEFSNSARDMFKFAVNNYYNVAKEGENSDPVPESSNAIEFFQNVIQHFLDEVRKNDQSPVSETDAVDGADQTLEGDPVDIMNLVPTEPSSLPIVSIADLYTRSMLKCLAGYPLYDPQPLSEFSKEYMRNGVNVGDVGFVRGDGTFDFLFNICPSRNALINPPNLPDGFSLESSDCLGTRAMRSHPCETHLFQCPITRTKSGEYLCEGSDGAILEIPEGAIQDEAVNIRPFAKLAARFGVQWYEYAMKRGREISNGALYLITSFTKCAQWGIAVFDRKCAPEQGLKFSKKGFFSFGKAKYQWNGSGIFPTRVSDLSQGNVPNQCVFLRGYKIMIRQDIFDNLCDDQPYRSDLATSSSIPQIRNCTMTRQKATRIRGGAGPDPGMKKPADGGVWSPTLMSPTAKSDEVVLHANFNSSLVYPSDIINAALLSQNMNAKISLTHDDVWCDLLRGNFPKLNYKRLVSIARLYTNMVDKYDCISLEKISNSNVEDGNNPLQGAETLAFQGTLTTPDDACTFASLMISMTLPRELMERILLLLDIKSMLTCKLVNRRFNEIIQSSTVLQYFLACDAAGVIDNPNSLFSYGERFRALRKREDAWIKLKPVFKTTIKVNHKPSPSMIYGLAAGAYFLDDSNMTDLNYCCLPSHPQDNPQWIRIPGHGPGEGRSGFFVNFGMAIYEHDLIINVISSEVENHADLHRHSLDLVLLKFSTGEYHPLAHQSRIHIQRSPEARPALTPEIVGDNLALVVYSQAGTFPDKLFIFDWKTGHKRLQHEATEKAYSGLVFISPEFLLVPNLILSHFEVWHLPASHPDPKPPIQILSLQIPALSRKYSLFDISCNGEPNPFVHSMPYFPSRPFFLSRENSIIIINFVISTTSTSRRRRTNYTLIMHRRTLLDTIQKWTSLSFLEQKEDLLTCLTNQINVHQIVDPDDGSVRLGAQSRMLTPMVPQLRSSSRIRRSSASAIAQTSRTFSTLHISPESTSPCIHSGSSMVSSTSRYKYLPVEWVDWGPPISRWLQVSEIQGQLIATSAGQRYAFAVPSPHDSRKMMIRVADFNSHNFRKKNAERVAQLREGEDNNDNDQNEEGEEFEILNHEGIFSEDVYMGLKCVVSHAPDEYEFDQLLMDEERLLGLKLDDEGRDESIKVLYFG